MRKQFAVIGLGRFGTSVCSELYKLGHEVLAVDRNEKKVEDAIAFSTRAIIAESTDEKALQSIGINNFSYVIVAIGDHIQASILTTLILKEFEVENVWVKARNHHHHRVLEKIGADRIIHPEHDMGIRIAHSLDSEKVIDYIELSMDHSIVELKASKKISGKTLAGLNIRKKYGCTILGIKTGDKLNISPMPDDEISENDVLIVVGENKDLKRFEKDGI
ncbi:potassium channel family protein [Shouchella shacheensis]|uniref:potassium channel family protein n=1 Tax=Shouchella shacheensis TaxID=1649580 RepID=UPI00073FC599|nr:TrkA family potassium uptake protein [Shouchella shacheensis]